MKKRDKISTLGRAPQRSNCCAGQSSEVRGRSVLRLLLARGSCGIVDAITCGRGRVRVVCVSQRNVLRRYGRYGEVFFFLLEKEPILLRELIRCGPSIPVGCMCLDLSAHDDRGEIRAI